MSSQIFICSPGLYCTILGYRMMSCGGQGSVSRVKDMAFILLNYIGFYNSDQCLQWLTPTQIMLKYHVIETQE